MMGHLSHTYRNVLIQYELILTFLPQVPGDIEHEVQEKCHKMSRMGLALQPFIIVCGRNFMELNAFYVHIDSLTYEASSLLQALHILYQFYIRFNINYHIESENICYFV